MFQVETRGFSLAPSISTIGLGGKSLTQEFCSCRATAGAEGQNGLKLGLKGARGGGPTTERAASGVRGTQAQTPALLSLNWVARGWVK